MVIYLAIPALAALLGTAAASAWFWPRLRAARACKAELEAHQKQLISLRHDIRGILSPCLLIADRLLAHEDPAIKRTGDVIIRTVDRVTDRLKETKY